MIDYQFNIFARFELLFDILQARTQCLIASEFGRWGAAL